MNRDDRVPESLQVSLAALADLAVDHWRLAKAIAASPGEASSMRHAARRIGEFLGRLDVTCRSLNGQPFDAGLAARVVDAADDSSLPAGEALIVETLSPIVLVKGRVVRAAEVVTVRGTAPSEREQDHVGNDDD